jgi:peptide/nickel transport system permease protein
MLRFIGARLLQVLPTLLLVSVMVFLLQELTPGDPAVALAGEERGDPQVLAQIRAELWLDRIGWAICCTAISAIRGSAARRCCR